MAWIDQDVSNDPIIVPKNSKMQARPVQIHIVLTIDLDFLKSFYSVVNTNVNGTVRAIFGDGFDVTLDYHEDNIPTSFNPPPDNKIAY